MFSMQFPTRGSTAVWRISFCSKPSKTLSKEKDVELPSLIRSVMSVAVACKQTPCVEPVTRSLLVVPVETLSCPLLRVAGLRRAYTFAVRQTPGSGASPEVSLV